MSQVRPSSRPPDMTSSAATDAAGLVSDSIDRSDNDDVRTAQKKNRFAFVHLQGLPIAWKTETDLMLMLKDSNAVEKHPYAAYTVGKGTLKLVYKTVDQRDFVVREKLNFGDLRVDVEKPYSETGMVKTFRKVIYMSGFDDFESNDRIVDWLKGNGLPVVGEIRELKHRDTDILNGRRSACVELCDGAGLPGFARYSPDPDEPVISFTWPNMEICCRRCWEFGHIARGCTNPPQMRRTRADEMLPAGGSDDEAMRTPTAPSPAGGQRTTPPPPPPPPESQPVIRPRAYSKDFPIMMPPRRFSAGRRPSASVPAAQKQGDGWVLNGTPIPDMKKDDDLNKKYGNNFTKFFGYRSQFSNHFPCEFDINGSKYNCTEQYLFSKMAEMCGQQDLRDEIMGLDKGGVIKKRSKEIRWKGTELQRTQHAYVLLAQANKAKYSQNPDLETALVATAGTRLVECNPYDSVWGIRLSHEAPESDDLARWRGRNLFGDMLTMLREGIIAKQTRKRHRDGSESGISPTSKRGDAASEV